MASDGSLASGAKAQATRAQNTPAVAADAAALDSATTAGDPGPPEPPAPGSVRFRYIDSLRGIAALAVAWHHANLYGPLPELAQSVMPGWLKMAAFYGWAGVPVFFVISGFVISYSVRNAWVTPRFLGNFALRRSLRLDPSYLAIIVLALVLHFLPDVAGLPSPHENGLTTGQVLTHLVYMQNIFEFDNLSAGFWTLCIEMQFYLSFCLLQGLAQRLSRSSASNPHATTVALAAVFLPMALMSAFGFNLDEAYDDWVIYFFWLFFLGTAAWWTLDRRLPAWLFWSYVLALAGRFAWQGGEDIPFALVTGISIYLVGRAGRLTSFLAWRPLQYLGRISYSLYLIHYPVSHIVVNLGYRLTGDEPWAALGWMLAALPLSVLAAHYFYLLVEGPTARLAARLRNDRQAASAADPSPAQHWYLHIFFRGKTKE